MKQVKDVIVAWNNNGNPLFAVIPMNISLEEADEIAHKVKKKMKIDNTSEELFGINWVE